MAEYIKKETVVDIFNAKSDMALGTPKEVFHAAAKIVELLPAADVVEVVRCGQCKKILTKSCYFCTFSHDGYCTGGPNEDFYCADGERREDNERQDFSQCF